MPSATAGRVRLDAITGDIIPSIPNTFDIGRINNEWKDIHCGGDLNVGGSLTVDGPITTVNSTTLTIDDKNIELAATPSPTDALADGGGIRLKGTTDKTILWDLGSDSWVFDPPIDVGGGWVDDGTVVRLATGSDSVGVGTPIPDGKFHIHVASSGAVSASSVANGLVVEDSKNNGISILTPATNSGRIIFGSPSDPFGAFLAWSDSVNDFAIGSSKIGANLRLTSDQETTNLTLSGGIGSELATFAKDVTITGQIKITGGNPGNSKYLRSDAGGLATWGDVGWTDLGTDVVLIDGGNSVGIGAIPDASAKLDVFSTTKGFLPPRMTTIQIDAIASPAIGLESYDTTINKKKVFTGAVFKTLLTEDIGQVLVQETFASTNVRFFGELGLPAAQGWTDTATGSAIIVLVTETVFGEVKQVVRHGDNVTNGATTSSIALTAQKWIDINAFGASYGGAERLNTAQGSNGFFSGLQANAAENPLATGNRRYGVLFDNNAGNLRIIEADNNPGNSVTMDGTSGNPLIAFDEWFLWECVIPAGLGAAELYVNGILTTFVPTFLVNSGGLGTNVQVSSGSTSGANRVVSHDNFGVTIYEEAATKTLTAATMAGDVAQINIPEGKRDYTIILPDGNPRPIGSVLRLVASNLLGSISLQNENPAVPEVLYNGLRTLAINIAVKETIEGINTVSSGNVYLGFQTDQTTSHLDEFDANDATFPAAAPAVANSRNAHPILAFDDILEENVVFHNVMSRDYSGGNILVDIDWIAATAITGGVTWGVEFERVIPGGQDIDSDGFAAQKTATGTANGTSGVVTRTTITLTQAEADAIVAGDSHRLRLERVTADGGDTMIGDAQVLSVIVRQ